MKKLFLILSCLVFITAYPSSGQSQSGVSFLGGKVYLDGVILNSGQAAEGLLMNSRMINAAIHDYNSNTQKLWNYPNESWNPDRNVQEFVAQLPVYRAYGLDMVTVGMQGGHPRFKCASESGVSNRNFSMFESDGTLRPDAMTRLRTVIEAADANGIIVNVQLFYQNQDNRLANDAAVLQATDQAAAFLGSIGTGNILVEIANEINSKNYIHAALKPDQIDNRVIQFKQIWPEALVSASFNTNGRLGPVEYRAVADWTSFHANSISSSQMVTIIKNAQEDSNLKDKPIVITEDLWDEGIDSMNQAVANGAGWGFYRQGCENTGSYKLGNPARYRDGFQSLPINWSPTSETAKSQFFERVQDLTKG